MKRFRFLAAIVLAAGTMAVLGPVQIAFSAPGDCPAWTSEVGSECQVASLVSPGAGPWTFNKTLHVLAGGHIDATDSPTGIELDVNGVTNLDLIMDGPSGAIKGGIIETDDDHLAGDSTPAPPITIKVSGSVTMAAGSRISADNLYKLGKGGNISITAPKDMTMAGTPGPNDNCTSNGNTFGTGLTPQVYGNPNLGAVISAVRKGGAGTDSAGNITIKVGNWPNVPPTGTFTMERCALVDASSFGAGGEVIITSGRQADIDGLVLSHSSASGSGGNRGGGPITVNAGCHLLVSDTGVVSSRGRDPGADLVHLEGCEATIYGLVQSTVWGGGGHAPTGTLNRCNNDPVNHPLGPRAASFNGCVEVWTAHDIIIDGTGNHHGSVNVNDIKTQRGWIDLFAMRNITINANPIVANVIWEVSANSSTAANTQNAGLITIKAVGGKVATSGAAAVRADAIGSGSRGGNIRIEAGGTGALGDVALDSSTIEATGGSGSNGAGGTIDAKSFDGAVTGTTPAGLLNALAGSGAAPGVINTSHCVGPVYGGASTPAANDTLNGCGGAPVLPTAAQTDLTRDVEICKQCEDNPCPTVARTED